MPRYNVQPEGLLPPSHFYPFMEVNFRLPFESKDPIFPASSLQLSFERSDDHQEFFLERLTARDVHHTNTGMRSVRVDRDHVPKYALKRRQQHQGDDKCALLANAADVLVKLHAWKGEEHLGVWQVGKLRGEVIYQVVD